MRLNWLRRDKNQEADALTNGNFSSFKLENRIVIDPSKVKWPVFEKYFQAGLGLEAEKLAWKEYRQGEPKRRRVGRKNPSWLAPW